MSEFYVDIVTTGRDPETDRVIAVAWQPLSMKGMPTRPLTIVKEWEHPDGEKGVILELVKRLDPEDPWHFRPVGVDVHRWLAFLNTRLEKLTGNALEEYLVHGRTPILDLRTVLVLENGGGWKGSGLPFIGDRLYKDYYQEEKWDEMEGVIAAKASQTITYLNQRKQLLRA